MSAALTYPPIDDSPLTWPMSQIAIETTTWCNLTCSMCSVWEGKTKGPDAETIRQILTDARALGATSFVPCGAENFMRTDFVELLEFAQELGFAKLEVVTNGLLLPKHLDRLAALPSLELHISIDGPRDVHDALRGKGAYDKAVSAGLAALERGIDVGISTVIMKPTLATLEHTVDLTREHGFGMTSFQPFQPEIDGWRDSSPWVFDADARAHVEQRLAELVAYADGHQVAIWTRELLDYIPAYLFDGVRPIPPGGCFMPSRFLLVDVHGDVYPCFFMRGDVIGNVKKGDRIRELWHSQVHTATQLLGLTSRCPGCLAACSDVASF